MSEQTFKILSDLVKKNLVQTVQVPELDQEIAELKAKETLYEQAGFTSLANGAALQTREMKKEILRKSAVKEWREKGYLVINLGRFEKWHPRFDFHSTTIEKHRGDNQLRRVLALIPIEGYVGHVPETVLETVISFKKEHALDEGDNEKFHILTSGLLKNIKQNAVGRQDPLLLYNIAASWHGGGYYVVVAWWGADLDEIEATLGFDRQEYPALSVFTSEKRSSE